MLMDPKSIQRSLSAGGFYHGRIDGLFGPASIAAAHKAAARAPKYSINWTNERAIAAVEQMILSDLGFYQAAIDGIPGPATQVAIEKWQDYITFDRPSPAPAAGVANATVWPKQSDALEFYGKPGTNHQTFVPPYQVFYGDIAIKKITLNKRCIESGARILDNVLAEYGAERIAELGLDRYGGSYVNRVMRNGTRLSMHAFAAAWDWDPARNQLRETSATARFARPEYKAFIDAHEREGWISLGRARNFDWMHFQAARL